MEVGKGRVWCQSRKSLLGMGGTRKGEREEEVLVEEKTKIIIF